MVQYCVVPLCINTARSPGISFFSFPKDIILRKSWIIKIRRDERHTKITDTMRVCSAHFVEKDFVFSKNGKRRCLQKGSVPSVFKFTTPTIEAPTTTPEIQPQPITINPPVIGAPGLPPGLIVFKNSPTNPALSSVMQTVPLAIGQTTEKLVNPLLIPNIPGVNLVILPKLGEHLPRILPKSTVVAEEVLPEEKDLAVPVECNYSTDEEAEELCPLEDGNPPTDEEIYGCIQDIIHGCPSLEDITLRNVISRVSAKYPNFDLTPQHYFMKECVKKIIMGT